jgi:hypothetical protein
MLLLPAKKQKVKNDVQFGLGESDECPVGDKSP